MKPKRFFFRSTQLFDSPLHYGVPVFVGFVVLVSGLTADAGDILRGGGAGGGGGNPGARRAAGGDAPTPAASATARANARDTLARTTQTLSSMRAMQKAARAAAVRGPNHLGRNPVTPGSTLPKVPNGLGIGGLRVSTSANLDPKQWQGAELPNQKVFKGRTKVTIKQTAQQALLNWETFNVGKKTTVTFDQSKGGENSAKWIAFNKINDPTGNPTQILGSIKADGQVYIINQNGIIFGGSSRVNARGLTVSALPINDNLVEQGLLNNRDAQFLFSSIKVPGAADGTPDFDPPAPPATGIHGDVTVRAGAVLKSPAASGGRIMLVGSNVTNAGTISTEAGQTILAAGSQVGIAAHDGTDPSLRGLDVWIGLVNEGAGTATNSGLIEALTGNALITGREVRQLGSIESSTSVNLNGRIDLLANYNAVANPNFDNSGEIGAGGPRFLYEKTGTVTLGENSLTRILPDYTSPDTVPGTELPERSQIHIDGLSVHFAENAELFAPNADVTVRAGTRTYMDPDGNRTIFDENGEVEPGLLNHYTGSAQKFFFDQGLIYVDRAARISVAGSADVFVSAEQSLLTVELRGAELADSPLQRASSIRGVPLTVDIRKTGEYAGRFWQGTPLGDVTALTGLIQRNVAQLTAAGGNISMRAGESIIVRSGSRMDVSGGFFRHEGGNLKTSALVSNGRLVSIEDAIPERDYDGVFNGTSTFTNNKFGVVETFSTPLFSPAYQPSYTEGASGGELTLTAPSMAIDGTLRGTTTRGDRQRSTPPAGSRLTLNFNSETSIEVPGSTSVRYFDFSPTPPAITFTNRVTSGEVPDFELVDDLPTSLPQDRIETVTIASRLLDENGFGSLAISNPDGDITVPLGTALRTQTGGAIRLDGANITVDGTIASHSGSISLNTYNLSPSFTTGWGIVNAPGSVPFPDASMDRGFLTLGATARLNTAGLISSDLPRNTGPVNETVSISGGSVNLSSYHTILNRGSSINVSGGVHVSNNGTPDYGDGGSINIVSGTDLGFPGLTGGDLMLKANLSGYSGATGGSLAIQAGTIHVDTTVGGADLHLTSDFFRKSGFSSYSLSAIGKASGQTALPDELETYLPAILIGRNADIKPVAESLKVRIDPAGGGRVSLSRTLLQPGLRTPVSLSFKAIGSDDPFTQDSLEVRGDLVMSTGARITTAPGASVTLAGQTATVLGSVTAPGGAITVSGSSAFPFTGTQRLSITRALPTVHLGNDASLSVAGRLLRTPDDFGRRTGTVFSGGTITVSGNIVAEKGALLDASGATARLDLPGYLLASDPADGFASRNGLFNSPETTLGFSTRVDSDGGAIVLSGTQMLLSDATLRGAAGGDTATGGSLSVSSRRYYPEDTALITSADVNLIVNQNTNVIRDPEAAIGIGRGLIDSEDPLYGNVGEFALSRFHQGEFANLSLGGNYESSGAVPVGGNVSFRGDVKLMVPGSLRLAAGGVLTGDGLIEINAAYAAVGQGFRPPANPGDSYIPFRRDPAIPSSAYTFPPIFGTGSLALHAGHLDVGTLSLQDIGTASLDVKNGFIRGNGTIHMAGDLTLRASTIHPTSDGNFSLFAYDHGDGTGSITFRSGGVGRTPLSSGGSLEVYATSIVQNGTLRAPGGNITLGWDGTDLIPGTPEFDTPRDVIAGLTISAPTTSTISLGGASITSVSAVTGNGSEILVPVGNSPDGRSWIDSSGVNVSLTGITEKGVVISGSDLSMAAKARIDLRGGGDLLATRWIPGNGGSVDLLGAASQSWNSGTEYDAGDLVTYRGENWSARVGHSAQSPAISRYWTKVPQAFAIIPGESLPYAPYNPFNTGSNAGLLAGDPGFVDSSLNTGDTITLDGGSGVPAGTYTLLPRRYALLPGAFLVTPVSNNSMNVVAAADGSRQVSGYVRNRFSAPGSEQLTRSRFEIASSDVFSQRAQYQGFLANEFLGGIANDADATPQRLPGDAGYASFHGSTALDLAGKLFTSSPGLGAKIDISSFAGIRVVGSKSPEPAPGAITISSRLLSSWKAESLLIGGLRIQQPDGTVTVEVRTNDLVIDNAGSRLTAADIAMVSGSSLEILANSSIVATRSKTLVSDSFALNGDGALLRVSNDPAAAITRSGLDSSALANLQLADNTSLRGDSVILDSSQGMALSSTVRFDTDRIDINSGGIGIVLDDLATGPETDGTELVLTGSTLGNVFQSESVTLRSYGAIDLYGSGELGGADSKRLTLSASAIRGFERTGGDISIRARRLTLDNALASSAVMPAADGQGMLDLRADRIILGENNLTASGFETLSLNADKRIVVSGLGRLDMIGAIHADTPLLTGAAGSTHSISSTGEMLLTSSSRNLPAIRPLGATLDLQGSSITANSNILFPSGVINLTATDGDIAIGGALSVQGTARRFGDLMRFTNAGDISLTSRAGDVILDADALVSVSGHVSGGNAGSVGIKAGEGSFQSLAMVTGLASAGYDAGSFAFDAGSILTAGPGSLGELNAALDDGGFTNSRNFRIRSGDVLIDRRIHSREFLLAADDGSIRVTGGIDASGITGGTISLAAHGDLTLASGAFLSVAADRFDSAGKGGSILLEAGTQRDGIANDTAMLSLENGATIDLSVAEFVAGDFRSPGSSAFDGRFTGTLHLRAPRNAGNTDIGIASLQSNIMGASSVIAEGYRTYTPSGGVMNISLRDRIHSDNNAFLGAAGTASANEAAIRARLLDGSPNQNALSAALVVAPGVEIINSSGDLTLGRENTRGNTNADARYTGDWDLSSFRYGEKGAPGILTLRATGDLVFNNTLSDGFSPLELNPFLDLADAGDSLMWLGTLTPINDALPTNTQSWSYRLTAGADTDSSNFRATLEPEALGLGGSILVGEFYPEVPNTRDTGSSAAVGSRGLTANSLRISTSSRDRGTRFEVIRTGTGNISINAGRDIQLRNQFASIYTAGVAIQDPTRVFESDDFVLPVVPVFDLIHPSQSASGGLDLGAIQQVYQPTWSIAGGNIALQAARDIGRFTIVDNVLTIDSTRQMPGNWLYRRGFVDPSTGRFSDNGGFGDNKDFAALPDSIYDPATSTAWWIDYSNFFQGIGTLGGGNINMTAGNDIINTDAVAPTNARMAGRVANPAFGSSPDAPEYLNLAPSLANLVEYGGGDITITTGRNIDGGVYYVERGTGTLNAGGSITTNASRTPSRGILFNEEPYDPRTWLPTTLFVGKSEFDVIARGDVLLGPVTNPFLMPQGLNNRFWYKTYFSTFSGNAGATVSAYGGDITHRNAIALPSGGTARPILDAWYTNQNLFTGSGSTLKSSYYQPWLRLAETGLTTFREVFKLNAPNLSSTSFVGGINLVGDMTLAPSPTGNLELVAATDIIGLNSTGVSTTNGLSATIWTSARVNVSDAPLSSIPGILTPLAYQSVSGMDRTDAVLSNVNVLQSVNLALTETGSFTGSSAIPLIKQALHGDNLLHAGDPNPVRLSALGGDITGLTLFSPKQTRITAQRDITDVAFHLQNLTSNDISLVSAGRDIVPFSESSEIRQIATNLQAGNLIGDIAKSTSLGTATNARSGDIQINGPGVLEVLAGNTIDLGTGANFTDGTGTGITSIGNNRNPNLPFSGADLILLSGVSGTRPEQPAFGLSASSLDFDSFIGDYVNDPSKLGSTYLRKIGKRGMFTSLGDEQQAIAALEEFYNVLRESGREAGTTGQYTAGFEAIRTLFGKDKPTGNIEVRAREIRSVTGGAITIAAPGGDVIMASEVFGNPLTPPGVVTEYGGAISSFTDGDVNIGQSRIFTLRGGDIIMWSSEGNIAAGSAPRTVVTAPPTRVVVDVTSATVETDLGGLATGGGIGVLAAVEDVEPGNVDLIAPNGFVDAGDAGIRVTGNLNIAAQVVLNASNISVAGATTGAAVSAPAAPSVSAVTSASNTAAATATPTPTPSQEVQPTTEPADTTPSIYTVEVIGYGGSEPDEEDEEDSQ